jgi:hypothetical protein
MQELAFSSFGIEKGPLLMWFVLAGKHADLQVGQPGCSVMISVKLLDLLENQTTPFPRWHSLCSWPIFPTKIMQYRAKQMCIHPLGEKNMKTISSNQSTSYTWD